MSAKTDALEDASTTARESRTDAHEYSVKITRYVERARANGATWKEIAEALHVTKQAAQQRYGRKDHWTAADTAAGLTPSIFSDT